MENSKQKDETYFCCFGKSLSLGTKCSSGLGVESACSSTNGSILSQNNGWIVLLWSQIQFHHTLYIANGLLSASWGFSSDYVCFEIFLFQRDSAF